MKERSQKNALFLLVGCALLWSLGGILIKLVSWHPMAIAGVRSGIAALTILLLLGKPRFTGSFLQLGAAISYALAVSFLVLATKWTTAANAILLQYTGPIYVALFGRWFLKERTSRADIITMVLVFIGMICFFQDELTTEGFYGNIFGALSGLAFGWFVIFMRKGRHEAPLSAVLFGNLLAFCLGLPFMFTAMPSATSWVGLLLLGVLQLGLPHYMYGKAIQRVKAMDSVTTILIEPILNPLWVALFIGEMPGNWAMVGGVLVLSSVTTRSLLRLKLER